MNSEKYSDIIKRRVVPAMENGFPNGDGIFQHDFAPCHSSRKVKKVTEDLKINMLHWPGNSPDLNPFENIQSIAKGRLGKMDYSTNEQLTSNIIKVGFHDDEIRNMCENLLCQCQMI
jgi:transposase